MTSLSIYYTWETYLLNAPKFVPPRVTNTISVNRKSECLDVKCTEGSPSSVIYENKKKLECVFCNKVHKIHIIA